MAIQGQWAQLLQVALSPAVGASIKVLPGLRVLLFHQLQLYRFKFIMHDAIALPQQHICASFALDVIA
jgi:hypothetical protein